MVGDEWVSRKARLLRNMVPEADQVQGALQHTTGNVVSKQLAEQFVRSDDWPVTGPALGDGDIQVCGRNVQNIVPLQGPL